MTWLRTWNMWTPPRPAPAQSNWSSSRHSIRWWAALWPARNSTLVARPAHAHTGRNSCNCPTYRSDGRNASHCLLSMFMMMVMMMLIDDDTCEMSGLVPNMFSYWMYRIERHETRPNIAERPVFRVPCAASIAPNRRTSDSMRHMSERCERKRVRARE